MKYLIRPYSWPGAACSLLASAARQHGRQEVAATVNGEKIYSDELAEIVDETKAAYEKQGWTLAGTRARPCWNLCGKTSWI